MASCERTELTWSLSMNGSIRNIIVFLFINQGWIMSSDGLLKWQQPVGLLLEEFRASFDCLNAGCMLCFWRCLVCICTGLYFNQGPKPKAVLNFVALIPENICHLSWPKVSDAVLHSAMGYRHANRWQSYTTKTQKFLFRVGAHSPCNLVSNRIVLLLPSRSLVMPVPHY
jgi:hypothetical protein